MTIKPSTPVVLNIVTLGAVVGAGFTLGRSIERRDTAAREAMTGYVVELRASINEVGNKLAMLEAAVDVKTSDRFTLTAAAEVGLRNAMANPGMRFADPRNPTEYFYVEPK